MKSNATKLIVALAAGSALFAAVPAQADGRYARSDVPHAQRDHREWRGHGQWRDDRHDRRDRDDRHSWRDRDDRRGPVVIRERVIVQRPPVVRSYGYGYYAPPRHYRGPAYYAPPVYAHDPSVVIGFNIPPIIIPIR